ncbi:hypothetical protein [Paramesorhizobium deserti]|nr:hypothetical protein [Paramesorhizobium deserti]
MHILISGAILASSTVCAAADQLKTMDEVGKAIQGCWVAPAGMDMEGSFVTLSFSFRRDGTLFGQPRTTAIHVKGDDQARKAFIDAAVGAIERCAPFDFAPTLAAGIGGRVFTIQFTLP